MPLSALPSATRGAALLTAAARAAGREAGAAAAAALGELLGAPVAIAARPLPGPAAAAAGLARVELALEGVGAPAALEVEAALLARTLERLAGEPARTPAARRATPREVALLELCTLAALDAAAALPGGAGALVPRLASPGAGAGPGPQALAVALELAVGEARGRGRLLVPPAAIRALAGEAEPTEAAAALPVDAGLCAGAATLARGELDLLGPGDVLLLDEARRDALALPGGLALRGRLEGARFHVEEIAMTETQASYPLTLAVEVARVTLTFGELARLEPGAVLALDARRDAAVVLRAGERALARGELVEVDGALGVRVLALEGRP